MADHSQLPNVPHDDDTRVPITPGFSDYATVTTHSVSESPSSSSSSSSSSHSKPNPKHKPLDPQGQMFHCMLSYRQATDQGMVIKLHNKLHTLFAVEDRSNNSLPRSRSGTGLGAAPPSPTVKRGWNVAAKAVLSGNFTSMIENGSQFFPFQGETSFPREFERCVEAQTSDFHVFLDKVCLKNGEDWQGSGKADGGGFIGAILQSLLFVPILSVKQKSSSGVFEELPSAPDANSFANLEGSVGRFLRLNTDIDEKPNDIDNVLLELLIAKFLNIKARQSSSRTHPCIKILPFFEGNDNIFACAGMLSDKPHIPTNSKAVTILQKAGFGDDTDLEKLRYESVQSVVNWYIG
jgi:hypothetical protein